MKRFYLLITLILLGILLERNAVDAQNCPGGNPASYSYTTECDPPVGTVLVCEDHPPFVKCNFCPPDLNTNWWSTTSVSITAIPFDCEPPCWGEGEHPDLQLLIEWSDGSSESRTINGQFPTSISLDRCDHSTKGPSLRVIVNGGQNYSCDNLGWHVTVEVVRCNCLCTPCE